MPAKPEVQAVLDVIGANQVPACATDRSSKHGDLLPCLPAELLGSVPGYRASSAGIRSAA